MLIADRLVESMVKSLSLRLYRGCHCFTLQRFLWAALIYGLHVLLILWHLPIWIWYQTGRSSYGPHGSNITFRRNLCVLFLHEGMFACVLVLIFSCVTEQMLHGSVIIFTASGTFIMFIICTISNLLCPEANRKIQMSRYKIKYNKTYKENSNTTFRRQEQ